MKTRPCPHKHACICYGCFDVLYFLSSVVCFLSVRYVVIYKLRRSFFDLVSYGLIFVTEIPDEYSYQRATYAGLQTPVK